MGSVFAWSLLNEPIMRQHGVVVNAPQDWTLGQVSVTFSLIMGGFAWGIVCGRYFETLGPRLCCLLGTACLGSGFGLASLGVYTHSLPLLYAGGLVWGMANGWAYVPPVATLLKWFPERRGFASGACLLGYGGGAMLAAPLITNLLAHFRVAPQYLGPASSVVLENKGGAYFAEVLGELKSVVVATAADVKSLSLPDGVYVVGTGSTGVAETLLTMGVLYSATMLACSFVYRVAPKDYVPPHLKSVPGAAANLTMHDVDLSVAMRCPQFWLMWFGFGFSITGAYSILGVAKTMISEVFGASMPLIVTPAACANFVVAMSIANLTGRLVYPNLSDFMVRWVGGDPVYGRKLTFTMLFFTSPALYLGIVWAIHNSANGTGSLVPLGVFSGCVLTILSIFGGTSATRPAFAADLFGNKNVGQSFSSINTVLPPFSHLFLCLISGAGEITARSLSVVLPAAFLGPKIASTFRQEAMSDSIRELSAKVPDEMFFKAFSVGKDQLDLLISQKTITIARLLELLPPGTPDPTIYLYDKTMYVMAGLQVLALVSNLLVKPVPVSKHMLKETVTKA